MYIQVFVLGRKNDFRHFAHILPKFYRVIKMRNLASVFNPGRPSVERVQLSQISNKLRSADNDSTLCPDFVSYNHRTYIRSVIAEKPHAARNLYWSMFYRTGVIADGSFKLRE